MMAKIPPEKYSAEARRFATHHIREGTLSDDWRSEFRKWCWARFLLPNPTCAFCKKDVGINDRIVQVNPATADSPPEFRWFCSVMHHANWETNQPRRRPRLFG